MYTGTIEQKKQRLEYYYKNKTRINEYAKKYRNTNRKNEYNRLKQFLETRPWYSHWSAIKARCRDKNHCAYKCYGAKGIKCLISITEIANLWNRDKADKLKFPCVDRIDHLGHYTIENCRFIELSDNSKKAWVDRKKLEKI